MTFSYFSTTSIAALAAWAPAVSTKFRYKTIHILNIRTVLFIFKFGFGWSNGVILDLLNTYYDRLKWHDDMFDGPTSSPHLDDNRGHSGGSSGGDKNHGVRSALLPPTLLLLFVVATIRFMAEHHLRFLMKMDLPRSVSINKL